MQPCEPARASQADLLVTSFHTNNVLRYDGETGAFVGVFAAGGGLLNPGGLEYGPDGKLYVAGLNSDNVLRYNGQTGEFIGVFASGGGLDSPEDVTFIPEPGVLSLFVLGLMLIARQRRAAVVHHVGRTLPLARPGRLARRLPTRRRRAGNPLRRVFKRHS